MARRTDFRSVVKAGVISGRTTFSGADLYSDGVVAFHVGLANVGAGTGWNWGNVTRATWKANAQTIIDCTPAFWQALTQRMSPSNQSYPTNSSVMSFWLNLLDAPTDNEADICQFPAGANAQFEIQFNGTPTGAGNVIVGFTETNVRPIYSPKFCAQAMNIPASTAVQSFPLAEPGEVRGFVINPVGVDRAKLVFNGVQWLHIAGAQNGAVPADLLSDMQGIYEQSSGPAGTNSLITNPRAWKTPYGQNASSGKSYIEMGTGPSWAGIANEIALWTIEPNSL